MNVLLATSEAAPFAKTGGLADVCGSLPGELARLGHRVAVVMPAYRQTLRDGHDLRPLGIDVRVAIGSKTVEGQLLQAALPGSEVPVYFIRQDAYFDRPGLYGENGTDYIDNCERFVFFCRAVMESIRLLNLDLDVLHANDWQTGLLPAYLKIEYAAVPQYDKIVSIFTIHNLAYQGQFWHWDMLLTGLDWKYFNWQQMEFFGNLNLMKTGIVFADQITTVSPRYAQEIQTPPLGCGLEGALADRRDSLTGILNGVDYSVWNPATDPHIAANYDPDDPRGKAQCKRALQEELGLAPREEVPTIAMIGRLADQKGFDLASGVVQQWAPEEDAQWVILGTGEPRYHHLLCDLSAEFPGKVAARLEFSDPLAHAIEAGADLFLMPSLYEPCGLSQLFSLKYGTVPVVHATGGLADTITDATDETLASGQANGFRFEKYTTGELNKTLRRAVALYREPDRWRRLVRIGMNQDWSWRRSAKQYVDLYESALQRASQTV